MDEERRRKISEAKRRHGHAGKKRSPEYIAWRSMHLRCNIPTCNDYERYGGRGITVCERWSGPGGFERFLADVGPKPHPSFSIDRLDADGHYEPGNVRWASARQQQRNRSSNRIIEFRGERRLLCEWSEQLGIKRTTIAQRLARGWSVERALSGRA